MKNKIDIVITTYNGANHIPKLLKSIKQQTYKNYNCFVIDDDSKDNTVKIIKNNFPWVKLIRQRKNNGPSKNRNIAIKKGSAPYIVILDDDVYLPDKSWLSKALKIMENNKNIGQIASMIVSGYDSDVLLDCGIQGEGPGFGGIFYKKNKKYVLNKHMISRKVLGACTAGTIIRRDIFEKVGGFDSKYYYLCEDLDLSIRIHLLGYDVVYEPSLVTHHYESQAMGKRAKYKMYLYYRNGLLTLLKNYPIKHIVKKYNLIIKNIGVSIFKYFIFKKKPLSEKTKSYLKAFLFLLFHAPSIIISRYKISKFKNRSRKYLIKLNQQLQEEINLNNHIKSLIFLITNKCNAKCKFCFLYKDLNRNIQLLTLDEIRTIFQHFKELNNIVISGGESFLRSDIDEICRILIENDNNLAITIPTNGSLPDVVYEKTKNILGYGCKKLKISLSLDGTKKYHEKTRKIPDLFNKVQKCYENLIKLKKIYGKNLNIQINTVITKENINQLDFLFEYIDKNMPEAKWIIEPVRGAFNQNEVSELSIKDWEFLLKKINEFSNKGSISLDYLKKLYKYSIATLKNKKQIVPCCAGREFIFINYNGDISPCEILPPIANIRNINYNINQLLGNKEWNNYLTGIKNKKCYCTHFCWLSYSLSINKQKKL